MQITKKSAFTVAGTAAAALLTIGFAAPAMADSSDTTNSADTTSTSFLNGNGISDNLSPALAAHGAPIVVSPQVGDVASGNALLSGNQANGNQVVGDVTAPVASGNETTAGNVTGNTVGNVTGNTVDTTAGNVSNSIGATVSDTVDSSVGDIGASVSDVVGDATGSIDLGAILGR